MKLAIIPARLGSKCKKKKIYCLSKLYILYKFKK